MAHTDSERNPVEQLAEEFATRRRRGEYPTIDEYCERFPQWADDIRGLFPALLMMERLGADEELGDTVQAIQAPAKLSQLGDFRIIREVGRGGMGIVYEAEQVSLGRRVALKVLPKQTLLDSKYKSRFIREAKAAARLHHTNIVPVFGVGEQEGLHYYVMQFIYGLGLDEVLVELQRLREESVEERAEEHKRGEGQERAEDQGARGKGRTRDVSVVAVANSMLSGHFERTLVLNSDSEGTNQPSAVIDQPPETGGRPLDPQCLTAGHTTAVGRHCDTHHGSGAYALPGHSEQTSQAHSRTVYWQSVARIGLQAAEALQYAHDQGIIHRDVKPGNLLLDTRGSVWVTDFGLAKAADQQDLTRTGDVVGTLRYMAPEQFDGKADARSDVFSLGLTLYELLTLKPAFNERDRHKLIRQVTTGAPPRLRALDPHISRDLETIVHKAIDRDPAHRYQTAGELSADLQRYLGNEPIRARWISPATRFTRWCRRNPAIAALTTTIAILLCTAAVGSSIAAVRLKRLADEKATLAVQAKMDEAAADQARGEAEAAADREKELRTLAESERDRANTNFSLARSAVNTYLDEVNESELLSVPGLQPLREKLLSSALIFYTKFTQERTDDPTLLMELADAQYRLGRIHAELGDKPAAAEANSEAIRLFEHLRQQQPENLVLQGGLAHAYAWASRYDETISRYDESIRLCESILETEPHHPEIRSLLADTYNTLAIDDENDIATALAYHQQALELREALAREFPDDPVHLAELGSTVNNIGVLLAEQGNNAEALQMFERAVGYSARAYELQPHSIRWGEWLCLGVRNCAYKQKVAGATEEARQSFARLVALRRDLAWNNPAVTRLQADLYRACLEQSRYEQQLGNEAEANRAIREGRRILEIIPHDTALQLAELGLMYASLSRPLEGAPNETAFDPDERAKFAELAVASLRDAIQAGYRNLGALKQDKLLDPLRDRDDFRELLSALEKLREGEGLTANDKGTVEEQIANRREALRILRELQDQLDVRTTLAATLHSIGVVQTGLKQFDDAEESLQQTLSIRRELLQESPDDPQTRLDLLSSQVALGEVDWARGDFSKAHAQWQHCLKESAAIAAAYPDSSIVREGRLAEAENVIYGRYGRLGLWPLLLEFADRTARYERPTNFGTTGYGDLQLAQGVLAANESGSTEPLLQRLARNVPAADPTSELGKFALSSLIRSAAISDVQILPPDEMVATAQRIFAEFSDKWFMGVALAAAQYRAGEYAAALETVRPFRNQHLPFLEAAITQRLGDYEGTATLWDDAESRYQSLCADILQHPPSQDDFLHLSDWSHDWWHFATIQAVRREAYSVIFGGAYDDPWQHLIQARGYRLIGEVEKSDEELAAAVGDAPDDPYVWMARARLFEQWDEIERAEADWHRAVDVAGSDLMSLIRRGAWLVQHGKQEEADADFDRAASLGPLIAKAPFFSDVAEGYQYAWARRLGVPVQYSNSIGMNLRLIPPGEFIMGTPRDLAEKLVTERGDKMMEHERSDLQSEGPPRPVRLSQPFYLGQFEVTRAQFREFVDSTGYLTEAESSGLGGWSNLNREWDRRPQHVWLTPGDWAVADDQAVCLVTWNDAQVFCEWLSEKEGLRYVLPTEAQWEFACRAGTETATYAGTGESLADIAWTSELIGPIDPERHHPWSVGLKRPNAFGLYDMLGNVWEACSDWFALAPQQSELLIDPTGPEHGESHVFRGGAWYRSGRVFANAGARIAIAPDGFTDAGIGFRVAIVGDLSALSDGGLAVGDRNRTAVDPSHRTVESAGSDPMPLIQRGRWYAGRGEHEKADADFVKAASLTPDELNRFLEAGWWVVGPYPANLNEFCPPEINPDPSKPVYVIDPQAGLSDEPVAWQSAPVGGLGEVRLADTLGRSDGSAYALAYVYAPDECTRLLRVGVAQGIRIWCNRQVVFSADKPLSGNQISASRVPVSLQSGRNELLVRVHLNAPLTLRVADTPADRVLTFGEQGLWKEAADAAFASEASVFGVSIHDEGYFALIRAALLSGDEQVLQREGERLLQMALGDPSLWNQVRAAGTLIFVDNPLVREHAAELEAALTAVLPATSSNHSQYQDCLRSLVRYAAMLGHIDAARYYVTQLGGDGDKVPAHLAPLWALVMEREGLHDEALATLELGLHAAAEYQDTYWPWLVWFLGGLRDAEREITGGTARTDEIIVSMGRSALADWEIRDPDRAAFDHLVETWGRSGMRVTGPACPYLLRGRRLADLGRFDDAEADFNKAVELAADDPDVFIARAIFHADRGAPEAAADDLHAALQLAHAMDEGPGWVIRRKVALQAAIRPAIFERLVSHNEHDLENELWFARMSVLTYDGDLAAAHQAALQLERFGYEPHRAAVALLGNDYREFQRICDSRPANWNPMFTTALLILTTTAEPVTSELLVAARDTLQEAPDDTYRRWLWAVALYRAGRLTEAAEQIEPIANSYLRGTTWPVLAMIHHQLGDELQARQWLQRSDEWLNWQHPGTSTDAPRIFKPGVNDIDNWLVASVFNLEARRLIDGQGSVPLDELPAPTETEPEPRNGEPPPRDTPEAHDP